MTARRTRRSAKSQSDRSPPDIREIFALYIQASQRRNELLEEVRALKAAGQIKAAGEIMRQADQIQDCLTALEHEVRPKHPHAD